MITPSAYTARTSAGKSKYERASFDVDRSPFKSASIVNRPVTVGGGSAPGSNLPVPGAQPRTKKKM